MSKIYPKNIVYFQAIPDNGKILKIIVSRVPLNFVMRVIKIYPSFKKPYSNSNTQVFLSYSIYSLFSMIHFFIQRHRFEFLNGYLNQSKIQLNYNKST